VQHALLSNADRLLTAALTVLQGDNVALSRSLVILALEESGKATGLHQRRVQIAYAPEGERFVNDRLNELWADHKKKLELVHQFLVDEQYWFAVEPPDPDANAAYLGAVKRWAERHDKLKQRGFRGSGLVTHLSPEPPVRGRHGVTRDDTESLIT